MSFWKDIFGLVPKNLTSFFPLRKIDIVMLAFFKILIFQVVFFKKRTELCQILNLIKCLMASK